MLLLETSLFMLRIGIREGDTVLGLCFIILLLSAVEFVEY
jgi:hypothetical protein